MIPARIQWSFIALIASAVPAGIAGCGGDRTTDVHKTTVTHVPDAGPNAAAELAELQNIAAAFRNFHTDTGGWPFSDGVWWVDPPASVPDASAGIQILPGQSFEPSDTVMFSWPANPTLPGCSSEHPGGVSSPCWKGPYLPGPTNVGLGSPQWYDVWGHPRMYAYLNAQGALGGGGYSLAPNGLIFVWSRGPDGLDSFTCTDPSACSSGFTMADFIQGEVSQPGGDDIVVEVADSAY